MTKPFKVHRCLRVPPNAKGRDLVVGDLHGHRSLLEQALDRLAFYPLRDRVLSVGDLARNRYQSLAEPDPAAWFALGWLAARIAELRALAKPALERLAKAAAPAP